jgi:hypothetical protein
MMTSAGNRNPANAEGTTTTGRRPTTFHPASVPSPGWLSAVNATEPHHLLHTGGEPGHTQQAGGAITSVRHGQGPPSTDIDNPQNAEALDLIGGP